METRDQCCCGKAKMVFLHTELHLVVNNVKSPQVFMNDVRYMSEFNQNFGFS